MFSDASLSPLPDITLLIFFSYFTSLFPSSLLRSVLVLLSLPQSSLPFFRCIFSSIAILLLTKATVDILYRHSKKDNDAHPAPTRSFFSSFVPLSINPRLILLLFLSFLCSTSATLFYNCTKIGRASC